MSNPFGWDYPPGCSSVPGDEPAVCSICMKVDDCDCAECPICEEQGNPDCYKVPGKFGTGGHGMIDPKPIKNAHDLAGLLGEDDDEAGALQLERAMSRRVYKSTDCGAWLALVPDPDPERADTYDDGWPGGFKVGSIVEGVDEGTEVHKVSFPCTAADLWNALDAVEAEARVIWNSTHGCEKCWKESQCNEWGILREFGQWPINPKCRSCKGEGAII